MPRLTNSRRDAEHVRQARLLLRLGYSMELKAKEHISLLRILLSKVKPLPPSKEPTPPPAKIEVEVPKLYCLCRSPDDPNRAFVQCDGKCGDW